VHGDIQDTNVMVRIDGKLGIFLVDFDWSGEIGVVRYPMYITRGPLLRRPEGAYNREKITADHDMEMVKYTFRL